MLVGTVWPRADFAIQHIAGFAWDAVRMPRRLPGMGCFLTTLHSPVSRIMGGGRPMGGTLFICVLFIVCCLLFIAYCLLCIVYCALFIVYV